MTGCPHHASPKSTKTPDAKASELLRDAIQPLHDAVEQTPTARALLQAELSRDAYVELMSYHAQLHVVVEQFICESSLPSELFRMDMLRAPSLQRDLDLLEGSPVARQFKGIEALQDSLAIARSSSKRAGLGALYVLEGSRMGARVLVKSVRQVLNSSGQPGVGMDYHLEALKLAPPAFKAWKAALDALPVTQTDAQSMCEAARGTMQAFCDAYAQASENLTVPA